MFVVIASGTGTWRGAPPSGGTIVMPPLISVATQTLPAASTASESNIWNCAEPASTASHSMVWRIAPGPVTS